MQSLYSNLALVILSATLFGCGQSDRPQLASVNGRVTFDGQPIEKGTIIFESTGNRPANGRIENGKIVEVTTFETNDGAPVGEHRVAIFALASASDAVAADPSADTSQTANYMGVAPSTIPEKYGNPVESGLVATIKAGPNSVDFELKSE